jgi:hypothetical protein
MTTIEIMLAVFIAIEGVALLNNIITSAVNRRQTQQIVNIQKSLQLSQISTKEVHEKNKKALDSLFDRIENIERIYQPAIEAAFTRLKALEKEAAKLKSKDAP